MMKTLITVFTLIILFSHGFAQKTAEEWQAIIDTTWGEGLPTADKLQIFDQYWNAVDDGYAGFHNLDVNWDSLYNVYRPDVAAGVSRGRFAAIMNQLAMALMEIHTHANDSVVRGDSLLPGIPLMVHGSAYQPFNHGHFGAGVTPLPDSTGLVYKVVDNHPLGLEPGDIVLGYEGVPWKYLYQDLLDAELPTTFPAFLSVGSSEKSVSHNWLMSAGLNWHLFDTIDILKYSTGDTVHLPTSNLIDQNMNLYVAEQLPVPGVPMLDLSRYGEVPMVSWGFVDGTQIGYIYVSRWRDLEGPAFTDAVNNIINDPQTTGLIIDFRENPGGEMDKANGGFRRLFNFDLDILEFAVRPDPDDHFAMTHVPSGYCSGQNWRFQADSYLFDKPIAVLTGPITFSAADYNAMRLKYHPMTKFFGKPTNSGFTCFAGTFQNVPIPFAGWEAGYAPMNVFLSSDPGNFLMHVGVEVDEEVWLTPEDVANGEDTVVKAALAWINTMIHAYNVKSDQSFIRPETDTLTITANVNNPADHNLHVAALINTLDNVFVDSLPMFDDGDHGDSLAGDGLYGCFLNPLSSEDIFTISASVTDLDSSHYHILPKATRFTSAGPVIWKYYSIEQYNDSLYALKATLENTSSAFTVSDITARLSTRDSNVSEISRNPQIYPDIEPGQSVESNDRYGNAFYTKNNPESIKFKLSIYSAGYHLWTDSMQVDSISSIDKSSVNMPITYALKQNYPNPFNPKTIINYELPITNHVELSIYNILGQKVATLVNERKKAGHHQVEWDASRFSSGIYYYTIKSGDFQDVKKMVLIK
jgi:hypothetical protein